MIMGISHNQTSSTGKEYRVMSKSHYGKDWNKISKELIKNSGYKCSHCGIKDKEWGYRKSSGKFIKVEDSIIKQLGIKTSPVFIKSQYFDIKIVRINLQAAHIIHNKNHDSSNLICLCERCHGLFDSNYHVRVKNYKNKQLKEDNGQQTLW